MSADDHSANQQRLHVVWHLCIVDGQDHAVTDEEFTRAYRAHAGTFEAVCGHVVSPGSMLLDIGRACHKCNTYLRARASMRSLDERLSPEPRSQHGWLRRLLGRLQYPDRPAAAFRLSRGAFSPGGTVGPHSGGRGQQPDDARARRRPRSQERTKVDSRMFIARPLPGTMGETRRMTHLFPVPMNS